VEDVDPAVDDAHDHALAAEPRRDRAGGVPAHRGDALVQVQGPGLVSADEGDVGQRGDAFEVFDGDRARHDRTGLRLHPQAGFLDRPQVAGDVHQHPDPLRQFRRPHQAPRRVHPRGQCRVELAAHHPPPPPACSARVKRTPRARGISPVVQVRPLRAPRMSCRQTACLLGALSTSFDCSLESRDHIWSSIGRTPGGMAVQGARSWRGLDQGAPAARSMRRRGSPPGGPGSVDAFDDGGVGEAAAFHRARPSVDGRRAVIIGVWLNTGYKHALC
jgi:hypothetical protein